MGSFEKIPTKIRNKIRDYSGKLILLIALTVSISLFRNVVKINKAYKKIDDAQAVVDEYKDENSSLKERVEFVSSEEFVEKQLREQLGLAKDGEIVVVLPDDETLRKLAPIEFRSQELLLYPNWIKWLNLFR